MTSEEIEESQSGIDESGMGGPGAPTPLSALEVRQLFLGDVRMANILFKGCSRTYETRHPADRGWWLQHGRISCVHPKENSRANQGYLGTEGGKDTARG